MVLFATASAPRPPNVWSPVLVPDTLASKGMVRVLKIVPPEIVNPTDCVDRVMLFTVVADRFVNCAELLDDKEPVRFPPESGR